MGANNTDHVAKRVRDTWLTLEGADIQSFKSEIARTTNQEDWPQAADVQKNIPIYDGSYVSTASQDDDMQMALTAEWNAVFRNGPGVLVIKNAIADTSIIDKASTLFEDIIKQQHETKQGGADHFAKPGANDRIWNSLEKHARADPQNFCAYYGNAAIAMASLSWLGPGYQVTAQLNVVNPGGEAQSAHRDYHLGFMETKRALEYPAICHELSPHLTLQGGIAHCDMPIQSGPTKLLPYSQNFLHGYAVFPLSEYQDLFEETHVQLDMEKGDAVFFNPALMHAAGANKSSDIRRMINLFQVGSAMGRTLENVDREAIAKAIYQPLQEMCTNSTISKEDAEWAVLNSVDNYPFPTNLDTDPPVGGLVPKTQAQFMIEALEANMPLENFTQTLDAMAAKRST